MFKRVAGPELSVAPLVEYPEDCENWTPANDNRHDTDRQPEDIRPIFLKTGLIAQANGSAYMELNNTKLSCGVYGPRQSKKTGQSSSNKGILNCEIKFSTFSTPKRKSFIRDGQEKELSTILTQSLTPAVRLDLLPKSVIDVYVTVLECDGVASCLAAAVTCASAALAAAGIEMLDLVAACSASFVPSPTSYLALVSGTESQSSVAAAAAGSIPKSSSLSPPRIYLDADLIEEKHEEGSLMLAYMPSLNEVTYILQNGKTQSTTVTKSVEHCVEACNKIYAVMRAALVESIGTQQQ